MGEKYRLLNDNEAKRFAQAWNKIAPDFYSARAAPLAHSDTWITNLVRLMWIESTKR